MLWPIECVQITIWWHKLHESCFCDYKSYFANTNKAQGMHAHWSNLNGRKFFRWVPVLDRQRTSHGPSFLFLAETKTETKTAPNIEPRCIETKSRFNQYLDNQPWLPSGARLEAHELASEAWLPKFVYDHELRRASPGLIFTNNEQRTTNKPNNICLYDP